MSSSKSKSSHTPGPWTLGPQGKVEERRWILMYKSEDPMLGLEPLAFMNWASEEDARLIAAAPELLEAVKLAVDEFSQIHGSDALGALRAALNKAEGE